jgi:hypothetical protein
MVVDLRQIVGSKVHGKALHVTKNAECSQRYGAGKTTKLLQGTVVEAKEVQKVGNSQMSWFIMADYNCGGGDMKRAELNIWSVKSGEIPSVFPAAHPGKPVLPILPPAPRITPPIASALPIEPAEGDQRNNQPCFFNAAEELAEEMPMETLMEMPRPPAPSPPPMDKPTTIAHQTKWWEDPGVCQMSIGGSVPYR